MLATVIVVGIGGGLAGFGCLLAGGSDLLVATVFCSLAALMIGVTGLRRSVSRSTSGLGFWLNLMKNHPDDGLAAQYRPRRVDPDKEVRPQGSNQPITAAEAHELQSTSSSTWVPSRNRNHRSVESEKP